MSAGRRSISNHGDKFGATFRVNHWPKYYQSMLMKEMSSQWLNEYSYYRCTFKSILIVGWITPVSRIHVTSVAVLTDSVS